MIERPSSGPIPPDTQVPPERAARARTEQSRSRPFWRELPVLLVIALAVAILIKSFLLQAFYIPSESMEPTLDVGDRVLVEKITYRFQDPQRGDVVVFERGLTAPQSADDRSLWTEVGDSIKGLFGFPTSGNEDFIKRVIGIGGDTVEGRAGGVYVNGDRLPEPYLASGAETSTFGPVRVPPGMIFVMGDNRTNSEDSRVIGPVPDDTIVGKALVILWPPAHASDL